MLFWLFVIASVNVTTNYRLLWLHGAGMIAASDHIAAHGDICGIGVYRIHWAGTGGYSHFGHRVPYFDLKDEHDYQAAADGFNVLLFSSLAPPPDDRFAVERCWLETLAPIWLPVGTFGDPAGTGLLRYCVAFRPGPCRAVQAMPPRSNLPRILREPHAATPAAGDPATSGGGP